VSITGSPTAAEYGWRIMTAITVKNTYKVFGRRGREAISRLEAGATADDVKSYGTAAVIDANFEVHHGEIFVVMGLSGSGKSTLIRMLNGLVTPTAGSVEVEGADLTKINDQELRDIRQKHISMVFQHFALLPHRTVLDNAAYGLDQQGMAREERNERAREALAMVGMAGWEEHVPAQLSGGMQQRVGLARALAANTDILLMDEAFSALDPLIRREMQDQLIDLQQRLGKTIVFITHDLNEAMRLGDRIAVMRAGRIVQIGTAEEILSNPANDYVRSFIADVDPRGVLQASTLMRRASVIVPASAGPRQTLHSLREHQVPAAFVVSAGSVYEGVVRDRDAVAAQQAGSGAIREVVDPIPAVHLDDVLADIISPAIDHEVPLPVVDDEGRLMGVIPRVSLLEAMSSAPTNNSDPARADEEDQQ